MAAAEEAAVVAVAEPVPEVICSECLLEVKCADDGVERNGKIIHKGCGALIKRVHSIRQNSVGFEAWAEMSKERRARFMVESQKCYGADLVAKMTEAVTNSNTQRQSAKQKESGPYMLMADAAELPRFKRDPDAWQRMVATAPQFVCQYSG
eukprot:4325159-Pyramimonas_sp.AAC.1